MSMAKWARFCISNRQEMPGSSEQGRKLRGLFISRSLPRWHDPDPLGVLSPAYIPENRKGRRGGARAMHRVLSDEAEEFRGYHCLGRSLQDSAHQLVLTPVPPLHRHLATEVHKTSRPWTAAG